MVKKCKTPKNKEKNDFSPDKGMLTRECFLQTRKCLQTRKFSPDKGMRHFLVSTQGNGTDCPYFSRQGNATNEEEQSKIHASLNILSKFMPNSCKEKKS